MLLPSGFDRPKDSWDEVLGRECSETAYQRTHTRYAPFLQDPHTNTDVPT